MFFSKKDNSASQLMLRAAAFSASALVAAGFLLGMSDVRVVAKSNAEIQSEINTLNGKMSQITKEQKDLKNQIAGAKSQAADYSTQITNLSYEIDLIVLAGFLTILSADFTARWPSRILNVHPSLIPAFCGKGMYGLKVHEAALAKGVKVTGATVHFVNEIPDGGEILLQKAVEVLPDDTPETLQCRVMEQAEWQLLPRAAELVSEQMVKIGRAHV